MKKWQIVFIVVMLIVALFFLSGCDTYYKTGDFYIKVI